VPRDAENLRKLIRELGFDALEDYLMKHARPSIRVYTQPVEDEQHIALGQSKIGGRPDLPNGISWPQVKYHHGMGSLPFLAQFSVSEVKPFDAEDLLPERGLLYFFAEPVHPADDRDQGRVIYYDGDFSLLKRTPFPDDITPDKPRDWGERYTPCAVELIPEVNLPYIDAGWVEPNEDQYPEGKTWRDFSDVILAASYREDWTVNRLLGYNFDVPEDIQLDCELISEYGTPYNVAPELREKHEKTKGEWQLLLQLGSDENANMMWSDVGMVGFYIRREDLKRKHFASTCFTFFTS
jgi:hypothetical protein